MNGIDINPNPAMCRYLARSTDLFQNDPITIVDVGARNGFNAEWKVFGEGMRVFCFGPDKDECTRLNGAAPPQVTYIPAVLGRARQGQTLYQARLSYNTGLYPASMDFGYRLLNGKNGELVGQEVVWIETLSQVMAERKIGVVNFIKLDAEGAELDILLGATDILRPSALFGVLTEIRYHPELNGSPPFWQMDQYLQAQGFRLFDMSGNKQSRVALPYGGVTDYFLPDGKRFYSSTVHGQVMDGDALYFRDPLIAKNKENKENLRPIDVLKLAAFYELYHHNDAAAELILGFREQIKLVVDCDLLLELLTPPLKGEKMPYQAYLAKYFHPDTSFAPALEERFAPTPATRTEVAPPVAAAKPESPSRNATGRTGGAEGTVVSRHHDCLGKMVAALESTATEALQRFEEAKRSRADLQTIERVSAALLNCAKGYAQVLPLERIAYGLDKKEKENVSTSSASALAELAAMRDARDAALGTRDHALAQLRQVYASTSWRITKPIRAFKRLLRRVGLAR
jgi:FkbM family methyltransferase